MKFALLSSAACAVAQDIFLAKTANGKIGPSHTDLARAQTRKQVGRLAGSSPLEISTKLNSHINKMGGAKKNCDEHSLSELNDIVRALFARVSPELQDIYMRNADSRAKRFETLAEYEVSWENEKDDETLRHTKCFEIGELWAHHLPEVAKNDLVSIVPTIPMYDPTKSNKLYEESATCQTGHVMVAGGDGTSTHQWPDWPEELHYKAKGHGAYPFWWGGGSDSGTADLEVWWSEKQGAEKFHHSSCVGKGTSKGRKLAAGKGKGNATTDISWLNGPCVHLMLAPKVANGAPQSYLYTDDEKTCCNSEPTTSSGPFKAETLAPSQGTFWNTFKYIDTRAFNGTYYQGEVKYYWIHKSDIVDPLTDFWYFTDLEGKPVQQGEGGTGPTDQGYPTSIGHTIWHDYDPSTFDSSPMDPSIFMIPESCRNTQLTCAFP